MTDGSGFGCHLFKSQLLASQSDMHAFNLSCFGHQAFVGLSSLFRQLIDSNDFRLQKRLRFSKSRRALAQFNRSVSECGQHDGQGPVGRQVQANPKSGARQHGLKYSLTKVRMPLRITVFRQNGSTTGRAF